MNLSENRGDIKCSGERG